MCDYYCSCNNIFLGKDTEATAFRIYQEEEVRKEHKPIVRVSDTINAIYIIGIARDKIVFQVVSDLFPNDKYTITCVDYNLSDLPAQPVNCAELCAKIRLDSSKFPHIIILWLNMVYTEDDYDIPYHSRILIFDDLIATGNSLKCASDLVKSQDYVTA